MLIALTVFLCKKFEKQRKEKPKQVDQCNSCTLSTYLSSISFKHCILWLFVRAGENFPLIVVMLAETPWANAFSSFVPQLGLLLCFSMFDAKFPAGMSTLQTIA